MSESLIPRGEAAEHARVDAASARADATKRKLALEKQIADQKAAAADEIAAIQARHNALMSAKLAELAPLKAELERLTEIAETFDIYLGRGEQVELIRAGAPAGTNVPIVVRSNVLYADEESLALVEHGGVDFRTVDVFLDWLIASEENLSRVVPDAKCIVAIKPSRQARDHGDAWYNAVARSANDQAMWVIRNGERVYILDTGVDIRVGERIVPKADEFTAMFTDRWTGQPLEPGTEAWRKAEQQATAKQKHFMKLMLIIQGLLDRSVCLAPLPAGGINMMSMSAQTSGQVVLLDEDRLALTDGRPSFRVWQKRLNGQLRIGMRVILATTSQVFADNNDERDYNGRRTYRNYRINPSRCGSLPDPNVPHLIEKQGDGVFTIRFVRTDEVWKRNLPVPNEPGYVYTGLMPVAPKQRASLWFTADDSWVLPFDAATREELVYYLNRRADRVGYLQMVPVLRAAIAAKDAEAAAEAGMRGFLAERTGLDAAGVDDLVTWFKTAHGSAKPLHGDGPHEAAAAKAILAEHERRTKAAAHAATDARVAAAARSAIPGLLAVARTGSGKYQGYTVTDAERGPWLTVHDLGTSGAVLATREWTALPPKSLPTLDIVWSDPAWADVPLRPDLSGHVTTSELTAMSDTVRQYLIDAGHRPIVTVVHWGSDGYSRRQVTGYAWRSDADLSDVDAALDVHLVGVAVRFKRAKNGSLDVTEPVESRWASWRRYGSTDGPWEARDSRYFKPGTRSELIWVDDAQLDLVREFDAAAEVRRKDRLDRKFVDGVEAHRAIDSLKAAWMDRETQKARAEFAVDFGGDTDPALWEHHLGTLALDRKWRVPSWADPVFRGLAAASIPWAGRSVADLVETYRTQVLADPGDATEVDDDWLSLVLAAPGA